MLGGFAGRFGLSRDQALRLGAAFGSGMARTGQLCGALSGAMLVLGLAHGQAEVGDDAAKERTYAATQELFARFRERHGALTCRDLLGLDIGTPEGRDAAMQAGLFRTRCPAYVRDAAELAAALVAPRAPTGAARPGPAPTT